MDTQEVHHEIDLGPRTAQKEWQASEARNCKPATGSPIEFDVREESIPNLLSK
jgi:hypothetical protein